MTTTQEQADCRAPSAVAMRASASWFLDQRTLLRHEALKVLSVGLGGFLEHLASAVEQHAAKLPPSDAPAQVAMIGVGEARRRMTEQEAAGLNGETERVKRLARSVVALCDHLDALTGERMCLACDKPLDDGRPTLLYDEVGPPGGVMQSGHIHAACAGTGRPRR